MTDYSSHMEVAPSLRERYQSTLGYVHATLEQQTLLLEKHHPDRMRAEDPLPGFCHGSPGTGKSRVIKWVTRLFVEALGWHPEDEFLCVALQNQVAHAMEGTYSDSDPS